MITSFILAAALSVLPEQRIYGGNGLDRVRAVAQRLKIDFRDRELNRVFDPKTTEFESMSVNIEFDRVTVSITRVGDWPPRVRPFVTVYRGHADFETLKRLIRTKG